MRNIKLTIEYDGTNYNGWQIQANSQRTVQGKIENALKKIFKKNIKLYGSGRTDSGVHALGQVAHFKTSGTLTTQQITRALNANLPEDITVLASEEVPLEFHAQFDAKSKIYQYRILMRQNRPAINRNYVLFFPFPLNITRMRREAKALIGRKDFTSFQAFSRDQKNKKINSIRNIMRCDFQKKGDILFIEIEANGFLYKMVRNIVGALLKIGAERMPLGSIEMILSKKNRIHACETAPAHGLSLIKVNYK